MGPEASTVLALLYRKKRTQNYNYKIELQGFKKRPMYFKGPQAWTSSASGGESIRLIEIIKLWLDFSLSLKCYVSNIYNMFQKQSCLRVWIYTRPFRQYFTDLSNTALCCVVI